MKSSLMVLPPELRVLVYKALFSDVEQQFFPHPILNASRQIRDESMPVLIPTLYLQISDVSSSTDIYPIWAISFCSQYPQADPPRNSASPRCYLMTNFCGKPRLVDSIPFVNMIRYNYFEEPKRWNVWTWSLVEFNGEGAEEPNVLDRGSRGPRNGNMLRQTRLRQELGGASVCSVDVLRRILSVLHA